MSARMALPVQTARVPASAIPSAGACDATSGECICEAGFKGPLCYEFDCPNNCTSSEHSSRATGCDNKAGNTCVCRDGFTGTSCEDAACGAGKSGVPCNGRGTCDEGKNKCQCVAGWSGQLCNLKLGCGECFNGQCSNGTCACNKGYRGASCNKRICEGKGGITCSGHGKCLKDSNGFDAKCECSKGFTGAQCEGTMCPADKNGLTCGGDDRGACNLETKQCECHCDIDSKDPKKCFGGAACEKLACGASVASNEICSNRGHVSLKAKETIRLSCVNAGVVTRVKFARSLNAQ